MTDLHESTSISSIFIWYIPFHKFDIKSMVVDLIKGFREIDCTEISSTTTRDPTVNNVAYSINCVETTETFLKPNWLSFNPINAWSLFLEFLFAWLPQFSYLIISISINFRFSSFLRQLKSVTFHFRPSYKTKRPKIYRVFLFVKDITVGSC